MVFDVSIGIKRENVYLEILILPICPYKAWHVIFKLNIIFGQVQRYGRNILTFLSSSN